MSKAIILFIITVMLMDYYDYLRGGRSLLHRDVTQLEKDLREIQKLEIKNKLKELKNK